RSRELVQKAAADLPALLVTEESRQLAAEIEGSLGACASGQAELERLTGMGDADGATKLLTERLAPQYQALAKSSQRLIEIDDGLVENDRRKVDNEAFASRWILMSQLLAGAI